MLVVAFTMTSCSLFNSLFSSPTGPIVQSCDHRIDVKVVSCQRTGSSVTFNYVITNQSFGNAKDFRVYGPGRGGSQTTVYDNEGNQYKYSMMMTLGKDKNNSEKIVKTPLLEGVPCNGSFVVKDVPATATQMSFILQVDAYAHKYDTDSEFITFKNIPIE